jgi:hypothetical protein
MEYEFFGNRTGCKECEKHVQTNRFNFAQTEFLRHKKGGIMRNSHRMLRGRELLTITYDGHVFFECKSATLKPGGRAELGRVADVINLFPEIALHLELSLDSTGFQAKARRLNQARVRALKDALVGQGLNPGGVRTAIHHTSPTLHPQDSVTVKVIHGLITTFRQAQAGCQRGGGQPYRQAC